MTSIEEFIVDYLATTTRGLQDSERRGAGREVIGATERPEDEEIGIDRFGEEVLRQKIGEHGLDIHVFSEHEDMPKSDSEFYGVLDPLDGSSIYRQGLPHMLYVALGIFDKNFNPVAAGVSEVMADRIYITRSDGSYMKFLDTGKEKKLVPSNKKDLEDAVIGSYMMKHDRLFGFLSRFGKVLERISPKTFIYPNGGPSLFPYVAGGNVDIYLVESEPRLEIDSDYYLALNSGCLVMQMVDGSLKPYKFIPGKKDERVALLVTPNEDLQKAVMSVLSE